MADFETLKVLTEEGSVRIIQITSVPRSASTMLGRTLNESADNTIYINEPFSRQVSDVDTAANNMLAHAMPTLESTSEPLTIVSKNMASYLTDEAFDAFCSIVSANLWTIRQPLIQLGSLATRLANDIHVARGADQIDQENIEQYLQEISDYLESSERSQGFSKTGWESIGRLFSLQPETVESFVVDADILVTDPYRVIEGLSGALSLGYSSNMIDNWQHGFVNVCNGDDKAETARSAWTSEVAKSKRIKALPRKPLDIHQMPGGLKKHIDEVATPTYEHLYSFIEAPDQRPR
jgi:hypothetical protein